MHLPRAISRSLRYSTRFKCVARSAVIVRFRTELLRLSRDSRGAKRRGMEPRWGSEEMQRRRVAVDRWSNASVTRSNNDRSFPRSFATIRRYRVIRKGKKIVRAKPCIWHAITFRERRHYFRWLPASSRIRSSSDSFFPSPSLCFLYLLHSDAKS